MTLPKKYEPCLCEVQYLHERRWEVLYHHARKGWVFADGLGLTTTASVIQWMAIADITPSEARWPVWNTGRFAAHWLLWKRHKQERRESYKPTGERIALMQMEKRFASEDEAVAAIIHSISQNYAGIFPDKNFAPQQQKPEATGWNA